MALSEIEKLERRYAENPQGLTFAPLAEVHRKNGDVSRALELLRPGLQLHPDYVPASIVLGRCHLDLGDLPAAETAFGHVLSLDGENVIALKALAEIAERLHRFDQAEHLLNQLIAVDRSNDDAREQLERIAAARSQSTEAAARSAGGESVAVAEPVSTVPASGEPAAEPESPEPTPAQPLAETAISPVEITEPAPVSSSVPEDAEAVPLALEDLDYTDLGSGRHEPPPAGFQVEDAEPAAPPVEPIAGLVGRDVEEPAADEFMVETSEDIVLRSSGGSEFQVPDASQELYASVPSGEPAPFFGDLQETRREPEPAEPSAEIAEPEPVAELEPLAEPEPFAEPEPIAEPEPVAQLEAVREPERAPEPEPLPVPEPSAAAAVGAGRPAPELPRRALTAAETNGESVAAFFRRMLAARPPASLGAPATHASSLTPSPEPAGGGAPTRPAADALSLSSVFGEDTSALPPAVPAPGAPAAGVSFDEFFSSPGAAPSTRAARAPDAKPDDLDQFHAWLQNLKR